MAARAIKKTLRHVLSSPDQQAACRSILSLPLGQVVSPLISFLYAGDETIKWHSVTLLGRVVSQMALKDRESTRVVMRRLMWNLNDESGGIGWGSPEAMGEIMARDGQMAREYSTILISYIRKDGNYIEHEILQRGVLWGLGRLAHARPEYLDDTAPFLIPFLFSDDAVHRGLAAWIMGALSSLPAGKYLESLAKDPAVITIYHHEHFVERSIGSLAAAAQARSPG